MQNGCKNMNILTLANMYAEGLSHLDAAVVNSENEL